MRLVPGAPVGRQVIERYGAGGFRVSGVDHAGAVIVRPERTVAWAVTALDAATPEALDALVEAVAGAQVLLLGCGRRALPMDTGAACRTYSLLLSEGRLIAAALIPAG